jgi:ATP-binding cassette subfamily F protein 3
LEALNVNNTILDEMKECGSQMTELELRGLLGCFLFSGDDADKKIKILSGGEKARVALAKTIVSKANFLMLDEPTNHLDMHSCDLLIDALNKYAGSIILVSHDRYFIAKTANKIWEIVDHEIKEFKGGYEEWVEWKERMAARKSGVESKEKSGGSSRESGEKSPKQAAANGQSSIDKEVVKAEVKNVDPAQDREAKKELQRLQRKFQQVEEQVNKANQKKTELEKALADPSTYSNAQTFAETEKSYKSITSELQKLNAEYETLFEKIMSLES